MDSCNYTLCRDVWREQLHHLLVCSAGGHELLLRHHAVRVPGGPGLGPVLCLSLSHHEVSLSHPHVHFTEDLLGAALVVRPQHLVHTGHHPATLSLTTTMANNTHDNELAAAYAVISSLSMLPFPSTSYIRKAQRSFSSGLPASQT